MARCILVHWFICYNQCFCQDVKNLEKHDRKMGEKDIFWRSMCTDLWKWTKAMKIFVSHINGQQKVTSAEEEVNNLPGYLVCLS